MQKIAVFCLLVLMAGCGSEKKEDDKSKESADSNASSAITSGSPITPVSWVAIQEEAEQEESKQEEAAEEAAETEDTVESVIAEFDKSMSEFMKVYRAAKTDEEKRTLFKESYPQPKDYCERLFGLIEEEPASDAAAEALQWISQKDRGPMAKKAIALLMEHHMESEVMADIAAGKGREAPTTENQQFLTRLAENSPIRRVKGVASYSRVMQLQNGQRSFNYYKDAADAAAEAQTDEGDDSEKPKSPAVKQFERYANQLSDDARSFYETGETTDGQSLEAMMEAVNENFGDVVLATRGDNVITIGSRCEGTLFEMKYLAIGKTAPDIEGEDLDGESFKLSDYRGKIVVIDFWGDW